MPYGKNMLFLVIWLSGRGVALTDRKEYLCRSGWGQEILRFSSWYSIVLVCSCLCDGALHHFLKNPEAL